MIIMIAAFLTPSSYTKRTKIVLVEAQGGGASVPAGVSTEEQIIPTSSG
jgi:hypothetical protein